MSIQTKVIRYDDNFKGIIKIKNQEYSVDKVIIDEIIDVELSKNGNAITKKIVKSSKTRVDVPCSIYSQCGGCTLLHLNYQEQLRIKKELIEMLFFDTFNRYYNVNDVLGMKNPSHYRNKNQIVFKNNKGGKCRISSGFYQEGTHQVVEFENCFTQNEISDKIIAVIKELMLKMHYQAYDEDKKYGLIRHVLIKVSMQTKEIMVVIVTASEIFPGSQNFVKALVARIPNIKTIIQNINNKTTSAILGPKEKILYGKGYITDILLGKKFKISAKSFYQINAEQCAVLYSQALSLAKLSKNDVLLDAYCGVGTIGIIASEQVGKVIGVELVKDAVADAILNAKMNNVKNIHFFCDDASNFMKNLAKKKEKVDAVIMDPPRRGSDEKFLNALIALSPKKVIYISCNPKTQVIDLKYLLANNYQIDIIQPVDMFPHTSHIETVVLLTNKSKNSKVNFDNEKGKKFIKNAV